MLVLIAGAVARSRPGVRRRQIAAGSPERRRSRSFWPGVRTEALARGDQRGHARRHPDRPRTRTRSSSRAIARQPEQVQSLDAYLAQRADARESITTAREMAARASRAARPGRGERTASPGRRWCPSGASSRTSARSRARYPTIQALATLAFDNRRALFRTELLAALTMVDTRTGRVPATSRARGPAPWASRSSCRRAF